MSGRSRRSRILEGLEDPRRAFPPGTVEDDVEDGVDPAEEAYRRGLQDGREQAMQEMEAELAERHREIQEALKQLAVLEETLTADHENRLLEVTLEAASRIVRERIENGDPIAVRALREAMESLPRSTTLKVRLHPQDMEHAAATLAKEIESGKVEVVEDDAVSRGGCFVETPVGKIDATLETAEQAVRDAVTGEEGAA